MSTWCPAIIPAEKRNFGVVTQSKSQGKVLACLESPDGVTKECLHDEALANIDPKQEVSL